MYTSRDIKVFLKNNLPTLDYRVLMTTLDKTEEIDFLTFCETDPSCVSYFKKDRIDMYKIYGEKKGFERTDIRKKYGTKQKIGRFLKKYCSSILNETIERVYQSKNVFTYKIVEGEEISKYYWEKYYAKNAGTLNSSCMRYERCYKNDYFDLYEDNENISMLVLLDSNDKVYGRALLWKNVTVSGPMGTKKISIMDRQYGDNYGIFSMKKWGKENGYYVKSDTFSTIYYNENEEHVDFDICDFIVPIDVFRYDHYPYLDTFRNVYVDGKGNGYLGKAENEYFIFEPELENYCELDSIYGGNDHDEDDYDSDDEEILYIDCSICGETHDSSYMFRVLDAQRRDISICGDCRNDVELVEICSYDDIEMMMTIVKKDSGVKECKCCGSHFLHKDNKDFCVVCSPDQMYIKLYKMVYGNVSSYTQPEETLEKFQDTFYMSRTGKKIAIFYKQEFDEISNFFYEIQKEFVKDRNNVPYQIGDWIDRDFVYNNGEKWNLPEGIKIPKYLLETKMLNKKKILDTY